MATEPGQPTTDELKNREEWFTATPDPWDEIVLLEFGADRTFASTVQRIVLDAEPAQRATVEARLIATLGRPEITDAGRLFVCRLLGLIGTAKSVPVLVPLLDDRTADIARLTLDAIDDASVDAAYRTALGKLSGAALIGLIGSIAARGDAGAIDALTVIATDERRGTAVREAAERAVKRLTQSGKT